MILYSMKFAKKTEIKIRFKKNEGYFFRQHPLVEKSLTATDVIYKVRQTRIVCWASKIFVVGREFDTLDLDLA